MARKKNEPIEPEPVTLPPEDKPSQTENIISIILGLAVVLVIGAMVINAIRNRSTQTQPSSSSTETTQEATGSGTHTVAAGETLWSIAEKYYNDGFKWTEIQKANNLPTEGGVEVGSTLIIPTVTPETTAPSPALAQTTAVPASAEATGTTGPTGGIQIGQGETLSAASDKQYIVKPGDTLWSIAVATYSNGYRWVDIAKANSLNNPDVIHAGNTFVLP